MVGICVGHSPEARSVDGSGNKKEARGAESRQAVEGRRRSLGEATWPPVGGWFLNGGGV